MKKTPKMKDVALLAGVSPMTVSRAFRRDASIGEETRKRVMEAAHSLGYIFDSRASNLRSQRTGFVAAIIPSLNNANFSDTIGALADGLADDDLQLLLSYSNYDVEAEEALIGRLLRRRPEAVVLTGGRHTDLARDMLTNADIPVVETWDLPENPIDGVVGFSNFETAHILVRHLVSTGRRRICFVGGDDAEDTRGADRRRGFIDAVSRLSDVQANVIDVGRAPSVMADGATAARAMMARYPDTDAVIAVSDPVAFGVLSELQRLSFDVPKQVAVCGFGNYDISGVSNPGITTIDVFAKKIGALAAEMVLKGKGDESAEASDHVVRITPELIVRGST